MIEQILERIAVALETLVTIAQNGEAAPAKKKAPATAKAAPGNLQSDLIPGQEEAESPDNTGVEEGGIKTAAELKNLAQRYIQAAGDTTGPLVTFLQSVAKIFAPKEQKLIKIPNEKAAEAAKMIEDWCKKKGLTLPIEV